MKNANYINNNEYPNEELLLAYTPLFAQMTIEELKKYGDELGLSISYINKLVVLYKRKYSSQEEDRLFLSENQKYDIKLIEKIADDIIKKGKSKKEVLKEYGLTKGQLTTMLKHLKKYNPEKHKEVTNTFMKSVINWKYKYNMKTTDWNREYFKELIGGIKCSEEEKKECLAKIEEAIIKNNNNEITELNKEIFLKAYPESIRFLKKYYEALIRAHENMSGSKFKKYNEYNLRDSEIWREILTEDRNAMLMIYAPYLSTLSINQLTQYAKEFNIKTRKIVDMIIKYKRDFLTDEETLIGNQRYDLKVIRQLVNEILVNNCTKAEIEKKYKISSSTFDTYMEQLKKIDADIVKQIYQKLKHNSEKYYYKMKELIPSLYYYITNGIKVNNNVKSFTILDYYCLTSSSPQRTKIFIKEQEKDLEKKKYRYIIYSFLEKNKDVGPFESAETFAKKKIAFIINNNRVEINLEKSEKIINYLKENDIPIYYKNVYIAAYRYAHGEEILPLKPSLEQLTETKGTKGK